MPRVLLLLVVSTVVANLLPDSERAPATADDGAPCYVGPRKCMHCHFRIHKTWKQSGLAKAFDALKPGNAADKKKACGLDVAKDYSRDPKCLKCHTTGYGTSSGYPEPSEDGWSESERMRAKKNEGVTCEVCHGEGSLYTRHKLKNKDYERSDIVALGALAPVSSKTCDQCHVRECPTMGPDYRFDFAAVVRAKRMHSRVPLKRAH